MERAREREKVRKGVTNPPKYRIIADYRIIAKIPHHCGLRVTCHAFCVTCHAKSVTATEFRCECSREIRYDGGLFNPLVRACRRMLAYPRECRLCS